MLGMQYISDSDTLNTLFPSAELSLGIKKFHLQTFMGTNQSFSSNNLRTLRFANPFINTSLSDINNNLIREAYIGIRGQIASAMYEIKAGYKNLRQRALFVQNAHMPYLSDIIIDNVNLIFLHGEWDITLQDGLTLNGSLTSNVFKPKNQDEAWNLPPLEGEIGLVWIGFDNKFKLHPHLFFASTMPLGLDEGTTIQSSKSNRLYELNIQANYQVHRFVQGFIHAQNLLNNKWERWLGYPTVGVNVVGGITVHW